MRIALVVIAGLITIGGGVLAVRSGEMRPFGIELLVIGALVLLGTAFERWRYRPPVSSRDDGGWQRTEERFVDPASGDVLTVYYDPATGRRDYRR